MSQFVHFQALADWNLNPSMVITEQFVVKITDIQVCQSWRNCMFSARSICFGVCFQIPTVTICTNQTYENFGYTRVILNQLKYGYLFDEPEKEKPFTDFEYEDWWEPQSADALASVFPPWKGVLKDTKAFQ